MEITIKCPSCGNVYFKENKDNTMQCLECGTITYNPIRQGVNKQSANANKQSTRQKTAQMPIGNAALSGANNIVHDDASTVYSPWRNASKNNEVYQYQDEAIVITNRRIFIKETQTTIALANIIGVKAVEDKKRGFRNMLDRGMCYFGGILLFFTFWDIIVEQNNKTSTSSVSAIQMLLLIAGVVMIVLSRHKKYMVQVEKPSGWNTCYTTFDIDRAVSVRDSIANAIAEGI